MTLGFVQPPYPADGSRAASASAVEFVFRALDGAAGDLVVLPECANAPGLTDPAELLRAAAGAEAFLRRAAESARGRGAAVAANVLQHLDGRLSNVTWLFDERGVAVGRYAKAHLSPFERDVLKLAPGGGAVVLEWRGLRVGFLTCMDIYFAEFAERLAALRPDLVVFPSYQRAEPGDVLVRQAAGRALDMEACVVRASYAMGDGSRGGRSLVAAADGAILLDAGRRTGFFSCEADPRRKRPRPRSFGLPDASSRAIVEEHRRPGLYRPAGPGVRGGAAAPWPRVVAHRGLSCACPENTLPAFAAAVAAGADEIELDLWASKDGELVVCHDPDVSRTSNGRGLVRDLAWAEVRALDAGVRLGESWAGTPFCRLEDVLALCGGRVAMNIHIKEPGPGGLVVRRTRDLAAGLGLLGDIYIAGDEDVLRIAASAAPDIARCCLAHHESGARMLDAALEHGCARVQFWNPNLTEGDIARAHGKGIVCNLFFGNRPDTPEEAVRMCGLGIDAVLTNRANAVLPAVRRAGGGGG